MPEEEPLAEQLEEVVEAADEADEETEEADDAEADEADEAVRGREVAKRVRELLAEPHDPVAQPVELGLAQQQVGDQRHQVDADHEQDGAEC